MRQETSQLKPKGIRAFVGAKNYTHSREFYAKIGFEEKIISKNMSYFSMGAVGFYLQDYNVKQWIDNTMLFLEIEALDSYWHTLRNIVDSSRHKSVRLSPIKDEVWGRECFLHDPSGVLWHIGNFIEEKK